MEEGDMNTPTEYPTLQTAEKSFFQQLETPEFFGSRGGPQDRQGYREAFDRRLKAMIGELEQKRISPLAVIGYIREQIQYQGWRSFFFFQTAEIQDFLIRADLYPEQPYKHIPVVRALLPPLTSLMKTIEENCGTLSALRDSGIALPQPVLFAGEVETIAPGTFTGVPVDIRRNLSETVPVMIIDSGIDYLHEDLAHIQEGRCLDFTGGNDPMDYNGHGTHCSGILAGRGVVEEELAGVAPGADLYHGKIEHSSGMLSLESALTALDWALEEKIPIISMSLGTPADPHMPTMLSEIVAEAAKQYPVLICCAAGNSGVDEQTGYPQLETVASPADCAHVFAVGAVDRNLKLAPFSSKGSPNPKSLQFHKPDLCGPGVWVVSCKAKHNIHSYRVRDPYMIMSGTSMAAPWIAGAAAVIYGALDPALSQEEKIENVKQLLIDGSEKPLNSSGIPYHDFEVGYGVPDLRSILKRLGVCLREAASAEPRPRREQQKVTVPVGKRTCSWSGIPIGSEWSEGTDYYLCEDREDAYISDSAFKRFGAQAGGRKVSKEFLRNDYWARYAQYREKTAAEQEKQQRQIKLFKANILDAYPGAEFNVKQIRQIFHPPFFLAEPPPDPVEILQACFAIIRMKKKAPVVHALLWDAFHAEELPEAAEYHLAVDDPALRLKEGVLGKQIEYVLLKGEIHEGTAYWVPELPAGRHAELYHLEEKSVRRKRCLDEIELAFSRHIGRTTLPLEIAKRLVERWGSEYLLDIASESFIIEHNDGQVIFARTT
jgi:hypothetical protein